MKKVIMILTALVLIGGGIYWFIIRDASPVIDTKKTNETLTAADVLIATIITYTDDGFSPTDYLGVVGRSLTVQNDSSSVLDFASNDHPANTKNSELNLGSLQPTERATITLTKAGEWGYHNHNNPTHAGTITVE